MAKKEKPKESIEGVKPAKLCYDHIGGKLGALLKETFIEKGWIAQAKPGDKHYYITEKGEEKFSSLGVDLSQIKIT